MALDMWSRRAFLGVGSALGITRIGRDASRKLKGLDAFQAATQAVAGQSPDEVARGRVLLERDSIGVQAGPHVDQPQQRVYMSVSARRPGGRVALHGHHQHAAIHVSGHGRRAISRRSAGAWLPSSGATKTNLR